MTNEYDKKNSFHDDKLPYDILWKCRDLGVNRLQKLRSNSAIIDLYNSGLIS